MQKIAEWIMVVIDTLVYTDWKAYWLHRQQIRRVLRAQNERDRLGTDEATH